jgi:hypothetical protein
MWLKVVVGSCKWSATPSPLTCSRGVFAAASSLNTACRRDPRPQPCRCTNTRGRDRAPSSALGTALLMAGSAVRALQVAGSRTTDSAKVVSASSLVAVGRWGCTLLPPTLHPDDSARAMVTAVVPGAVACTQRGMRCTGGLAIVPCSPAFVSMLCSGREQGKNTHLLGRFCSRRAGTS